MSSLFKILLFQVVVLILALDCAWAQPSRISHRDRLGDSVILKDINETIIQRQVRIKPRLNSISFGPAILSDGIGLMINYSRSFGQQKFGAGKEETFYNSHFVQLEISERFHRKEFRETSYLDILQLFFVQEGSGSFMYGKVNNLYNLRLNYGQRRLIGGKGEPNSPLIQYYGSAGVNVQLVKPYYINVFGGSEIKYSEETEREFINREIINGKAGFSKGLDELEMVFAASLRTGFYIDFSKKSKRVSAFDLGVGLDYSFSKIHQMVNTDQAQWFFNAYISYQWGKKF